jgi:hypothetical protein
MNLRRLVQGRIRQRSGGVDLVGDLNVVADVNVGGRHRVESRKVDRRSGDDESRRRGQKGAG